MKKLKQMLNKKNILIVSLLACFVIAGIFVVRYASDAQAKRNVLNEVKENYSNTSKFTILEIVPDNTNDANEEIGYFVDSGKTGNVENVIDVSKARSLGGWQDGVGTQEQYNSLVNFRDLGLVKYDGTDRGYIYRTNQIVDDPSEYPIYSSVAIFIKNSNNDKYKPMDNQYVYGDYTMNTNNTGEYELLEGYEIQDDGRIYKVTEIKTPKEKPSVSESTVSPNSVDPDTDPYAEPNNGSDSGSNTDSDEEQEYDITYEYEAVAVGNRFNKSLPEGVNKLDTKTGNLNFKENSIGVYFGLTENSYYYLKYRDNNYYYNGGWFNEFVFGDNTLKKDIEINTVAASSVTKAQVQAADLVYLSGTYDAFISANQDISDEVLLELFNKTTQYGNKDKKKKYKALIMDYALLGTSSSTNPKNFEKLALLLWQDDQTAIVDSHKDVFTIGNDGLVSALPATDNNVWSELGGTLLSGGGLGNFVAGSVYVYDHKMSYFKNTLAHVNAGDFFGNGDFASTYSDAIVNNYFAAVKYKIQINNANNANTRMSEVVTPATVIQYILSYDGTKPSIIKGELHVLEVQPVRAFLYNETWGITDYGDCKTLIQDNRMRFIKKYLDSSFEENPALITFESMTIEEFIGRNEDLNATYDMIYIGSNYKHIVDTDTAYCYYYLNGDAPTGKITKDTTTNLTGITWTEKTKSNVQTNGTEKLVPIFNDPQMTGMVYFNIGDTYKISSGNDMHPFIKNSNHTTARFSGRDLTEDKKNKMLDFVKTGYPVIVAGDIVATNTNGIKTINPTKSDSGNESKAAYDHGRVDNSSKLYEFLVDVIDEPNLISEADVSDKGDAVVSKDEIAEYLNLPKLSIDLTAKPIEYAYTTKQVTLGGTTNEVIASQTQLTPDPVTKKCTLEYEFSISNLSSLNSDSDTYSVALYMDNNSDGKFGSSELLPDITVSNAATGTVVNYALSAESEGQRVYQLAEGVVYKLRREVPSGYVGIIPWKLSVEMTSNRSLRTAVTGYTMVPSKDGKKEEISILQIHKAEGERGGANTLDLETLLRTPTSADNYFGSYLANLLNYDVKVKTIRRDEYQRMVDNGTLNMDEYDMLILGFADYIQSFDDERHCIPVVNFIKAGRPVLMSHDFICFNYTWIQTVKMRDIVGMDRYGNMPDAYPERIAELTVNGKYALNNGESYTRVANASTQEQRTINAIESTGKRVAYQPNSNKEIITFTTQGFNNLNMVRYRSQNTADENQQPFFSVSTVSGFDRDTTNAGEYMVDNVNKGQITTYPYILPDSFRAANTHNQYFQVDLETDNDEDGEVDVVVWYTLGRPVNGTATSNSIYNLAPKDVVNNFYIYNKGNITYTGVGHTKPGSNANVKVEAQLFINTMISAYKSGMGAPSVKIFAGKDDATSIDSLVVPYDRNVGVKAETIADSESSVLKDEDGNYINEFVDNGDKATKVYFEVQDPNFLMKGEKNLDVAFFVEDEDKERGYNMKIVTELGETVYVKPVTVEMDAPLYTSDGTLIANQRQVRTPESIDWDYRNKVVNGAITSDLEVAHTLNAYNIESGARYGVTVPLSKLKEVSKLKFYVGAKSSVGEKTASNTVNLKYQYAYYPLEIIKMDLLNLE